MEVDSLCAWKVLQVKIFFFIKLISELSQLIEYFQYLFRSDHILYTIIPINCKKDLKKACNDAFEWVCDLYSVLLILILILIF